MIHFKKLINAKALYQELERIWVAQGIRFFAVDYSGHRVTKVYKVGGVMDRLLSCCETVWQLKKHIWPLIVRYCVMCFTLSGDKTVNVK